VAPDKHHSEPGIARLQVLDVKFKTVVATPRRMFVLKHEAPPRLNDWFSVLGSVM
jgi:hypothetical protein